MRPSRRSSASAIGRLPRSVSATLPGCPSPAALEQSGLHRCLRVSTIPLSRGGYAPASGATAPSPARAGQIAALRGSVEDAGAPPFLSAAGLPAAPTAATVAQQSRGAQRRLAQTGAANTAEFFTPAPTPPPTRSRQTFGFALNNNVAFVAGAAQASAVTIPSAALGRPALRRRTRECDAIADRPTLLSFTCAQWPS